VCHSAFLGLFQKQSNRELCFASAVVVVAVSQLLADILAENWRGDSNFFAGH